MNQNKLKVLIEGLEDFIKSFKTVHIHPEKVQIASIREEEMTYVHYWDPRNDEPRVLASVPFFLEKDKYMKVMMTALNMLSHSAVNLGVEFNSTTPWDELPEQYQKLDQIFVIEKKKLQPDLREYIKESQSALYNLSPELPVQDGN